MSESGLHVHVVLLDGISVDVQPVGVAEIVPNGFVVVFYIIVDVICFVHLRNQTVNLIDVVVVEVKPWSIVYLQVRIF